MEALLAGLQRARRGLRLPPRHPLQRRGTSARAQPAADARLPGHGAPGGPGPQGPALGGGSARGLPPRRGTGTVDLGDLGQRQRIVAECRGLVDEGFDGVHVNIEPVNDGNDDFLALLRALRTAVGEDRILSLSAIRPAPFALPVAPNFVWSIDYYRRVALVADQIVVMAYDTALPTPGLYRRYVAYAAEAGTEAILKSRSSCPPAHGRADLRRDGAHAPGRVETPENAILGIVDGLRGLGGGGTFEGVALYAEWTTDPDGVGGLRAALAGQELKGVSSPSPSSSLRRACPSRLTGTRVPSARVASRLFFA